MPLQIQSTIRIVIPVGGEDAVFVCRIPRADEISKFLKSRFTTRRNKVEQNLYPARIAFADSILIDVENVTYRTVSGETKVLGPANPLSDEDKASWAQILGAPVNDWRDLIQVNWKSAIAMRWEEPQGEGDDPGN